MAEANKVTMAPVFPGEPGKRSFTDTAGRVWPVCLHVGSLREVKQQTGVDLQRVLDDRAALLVALHEDPALLANVAWLMVDEESRNGVTEAEFCRSLGGDALFGCLMSVLGAVCDFLPSAKSRDEFATVVRKLSELADRMLDRAGEQVAAFDPQAVDLDEVPANGSEPPVGSPEPFPTSDR